MVTEVPVARLNRTVINHETVIVLLSAGAFSKFASGPGPLGHPRADQALGKGAVSCSLRRNHSR